MRGTPGSGVGRAGPTPGSFDGDDDDEDDDDGDPGSPGSAGIPPTGAGLDRAGVYGRAEAFGIAAARAARDAGPARRLVTLVIDAAAADAIGDEPVWHDGKVVGRFLDAEPRAVEVTESARLSLPGALPWQVVGPGCALASGAADADGFYYACLEKRA